MKDKVNIKNQLDEFVYSIGGNPEDMNADNFILSTENQMSKGMITSNSILFAVIFILMFVICGYLLMHELSKKPIHMFLDFNAVIVNLESMPKEEQKECLDEIEINIEILLNYLEENQKLKEKAEDVPATGMAVLHQQIILAQAIKTWIADLKKTLL